MAGPPSDQQSPALLSATIAEIGIRNDNTELTTFEAFPYSLNVPANCIASWK